MDEMKLHNSYSAICLRAKKLAILPKNDRIAAMQAIEVADKKFHLRLGDWLAADDFNFMHDFCGILNHINWKSYPTIDFGYFVPRFAGREE